MNVDHQLVGIIKRPRTVDDPTIKPGDYFYRYRCSCGKLGNETALATALDLDADGNATETSVAAGAHAWHVRLVESGGPWRNS